MKSIDYRSFGSQGEIKVEGAIDKRWWLLSKADMPQALTQIVHTIAQADSKRQTQYQISTRLYGNTNLMGTNGLSMSKISSVQNAAKDRLSYNIVQSGIDTVCAKMAKNKPKPLFLTSGGDWKLQRKAQWRADFVNAENSMGFHAPQEAARLLGEAIDFARLGQLELQKR